MINVAPIFVTDLLTHGQLPIPAGECWMYPLFQSQSLQGRSRRVQCAASMPLSEAYVALLHEYWSLRKSTKMDELQEDQTLMLWSTWDFCFSSTTRSQPAFKIFKKVLALDQPWSFVWNDILGVMKILILLKWKRPNIWQYLKFFYVTFLALASAWFWQPSFPFYIIPFLPHWLPF